MRFMGLIKTDKNSEASVPMRYRLHASHGTDDVTLVDELAFVRNYLALEQLRLGERLRFAEEIDPAALECIIPALMLQPLVENAVRHGVAPLRRGGMVSIAARCERDTLRIVVAVDGGGADPGQWERTAGFGLQVVQRQLATRFPDRHRFEVITQPGDSFAVRLSIPCLGTTESIGPDLQRDDRPELVPA